MISTFIETLSWGVTSAMAGLVVGIICDIDRKIMKNIIIGTFILGCIRGYTGKDIISLLY
jgi:hypothetical protein